MVFRILISGLICLFCIFNAFNQKYNIRNFSSRDGVTGQIVNGLYQDDSGYIWFATQAGISYYNGNNFNNLNDLESISGVDAIAINQDQNGQIWIGTNANGLFLYDFKKIKNYTEQSGFISNIVRSIFKDHQNTMWVITSKGVVRYVNDKFEKLKDPKGYFEGGVLSMTQSKDGAYWFGTQGKGLVKWHNSNFSYFNSDNGLLDDYIFSLNTAGDSILIGTTNQGLQIFSKNKFSKINVPEIEYDWISNVIVEPKGLSIVSSSGLVKYSVNGKYSIITEQNGLSSNDLYGGIVDKENNTWLVSGNGISVIRNKEIISFDKSYGLSDNKITALTTSSQGEILAGTYGYGLNVLNKEGIVLKQITHPKLMNVKITSLLEVTDKKELWVGGEQQTNGIIVLDLKNKSYKIKRTISSLNGLDMQTITKMKVHHDDIWVSTYNTGIFRINKNKTTNYKKDSGLPSNEVYTFHIDRNGVVWLSLLKKGLFKFESGSFRNVNDELNLKTISIASIVDDEKGNLYFGSVADGLSIVTRNGTFQFTKKDGLLSNNIESILIDGKNIWIGTDQGLNKLTFNSKFELTSIESYNEKSGLLNSEIQQNSLLLAGDYIWVGSSSGLSRLKKENDDRKSFRPPLEIFSVKLFFEDVDWKNKKALVNKWGVPTALNLGYKENHLTISFGAITASQVQYSYKLEGQDENWTPYSEKNEATLSNLVPGNYTFKLRGINNLGVQSPEISFPIVIRKPYWQTWWFRIFVASVIILLVISFIRSRERRYKEQQAILEDKVTERTKEAVSATERAEQQRVLVEEKNKEILSSITYAKRIQNAMLPADDDLHSHLSEVAVFYRPKDIVAGDFYWYEETETHCMIAVADCTGHGVPGALVSVVCFNALNRSVREFGLTDPGKILDTTREIILSELSKHDQNVKDGMDISLAVIEKQNRILSWAGANNPLWRVCSITNGLLELKADKQPIGMYIKNNAYTTHLITYHPDDKFVLFTDGYSDQFGGTAGKKFKTANLKKLLQEYSSSSLPLVKQQLESTFDSWKDQEEQVDDVCVLIFRV